MQAYWYTNPPEKDPRFVYKLYAEKRPREMNTDEAPFYLAINHCKKALSDKLWFKKSALGANTLNSLMKIFYQSFELGNITITIESSNYCTIWISRIIELLAIFVLLLLRIIHFGNVRV